MADPFSVEEMSEWICGARGCYERPSIASGKWRWAADHWQHHHDYPAGHIPAMKCECSSRVRMVGDGCKSCNPDFERSLGEDGE